MCRSACTVVQFDQQHCNLVSAGADYLAINPIIKLACLCVIDQGPVVQIVVNLTSLLQHGKSRLILNKIDFIQ